MAAYLWEEEIMEVLPGIGEPKYDPIKAITFHTRTTSKFYGDDYAVENPTQRAIDMNRSDRAKHWERFTRQIRSTR